MAFGNHTEDRKDHSAAKPQPNFRGVGTPLELVKAVDAKPKHTNTSRRSREFLSQIWSIRHACSEWF
jgi:hypothetical protein